MTYIIMKNKKQVCISCGYESPSRKDRCPKCGCYGYIKLPNGDIVMKFDRSGMNIGKRRRFEEE